MQKQAVRFWIRGGRKNKANALRKAGYSEAIVHQPHKVFDSPAVRRELDLLGHGYEGLSNGLKPKEVAPVVIKKEPENTIDFEMLTKPEVIEALRERLENTPPRNPAVSVQPNEHKEGYSVPENSHNHNIFGEELSNASYKEKKMKMSDFSSI